jgi:nicotinamide mononucleotide adenylyltransferase
MQLTSNFETFSDWYNSQSEISLDIVEREFDIMTTPDKRSLISEMFLGRFQPIHSGHISIIEQMKNPIIVLVSGKKSSMDKTNNPLSESTRISLIKEVFPNIPVIVASNAYVPDILATLRESRGIEIKKIYAGSDRISDYSRQVNSINEKLNPRRQYDIEFEETERSYSASEIREAIRNDDIDAYKKMMPELLWEKYDELKEMIG